MKFWNLFLGLFIVGSLIACKGAEESEDHDNENDNDTEEIVQENPRYTGDCSKSSVDDWDNYLGIAYGANELDLRPILGEFTGGEYTADSSAFKYYFNRIELAPLTIYVNGKTGSVETIFLEVLSKTEYFERDFQLIRDEFGAEDCDMKFLGITAEEMIKIMGTADRDNTEEGVRTLAYDTDPLKTSVAFRFYPSQGNMCTSVSLNWYY